jgi:hypothetical protein
VRWRIANPEEAQTQGERLRYYRDTVHPRRRRNFGVSLAGSLTYECIELMLPDPLTLASIHKLTLPTCS